MSNATQKSGNPTLKWVFLSVAFLLAVMFGFKSCKKDKGQEKESDKKVPTPTWIWVVTRTQTISINGNYSSVYYLSKGEGLSLKNSTQPYCVENENGHSVCGTKGEDVTPKLPKEDANMELKFRTSSSGKTGEITLVYWEKILSQK